jgi:hypothetical protein
MAEDPKGAEDAGVLGNLPRTRPGRRSDKRSAGRPAEAAGAAGARTPRPKRAAAQRKRASEPAPEPQRGGPIDDVLHGAGRIAGAGARIADGLAREVLRRLPRP